MHIRATPSFISWPIQPGANSAAMILDDADRQSGDHRAERAVETAERRGRRAVDEDREHQDRR